MKTKNLLILLMFLAGIRQGKAQGFLSTADSLQMKYIAGRIKDPRVYVGVFHKPDIDEAPRPLKTGLQVEDQDGYLSLRKDGILKLYTVSPIGQDFDSVIFVKNSAARIAEDGGPSFFPYTNTTYLLLLRKCVKGEGASAKNTNWMESLEKSKSMPWLNTTTAYSLDDPYKGSYYIQWNKQFDIPASAMPIKPAVAQDVLVLSQAYKALPAHITEEVKQQNIQALSARVKTPQGRMLLVELLSK